MAGADWNNPWKLTAIGMALVVVTGLITGLVVAQWSGAPGDSKAAPTQVEPSRSFVPAPSRHTVTSQPVSAVPPQAAINACHQYATRQVGQRDKTGEVVKAGAIGAAVGAAVGAAGGAIADGGRGAGKGAAIGGILGAGGGSLYGLNENQKHDQQYRDAYAVCMRSRGYTG